MQGIVDNEVKILYMYVEQTNMEPLLKLKHIFKKWSQKNYVINTMLYIEIFINGSIYLLIYLEERVKSNTNR